MVETVGGYDYKYITEVPKDLICSLCLFPFKDPIHIEKCGHVYCNECFEKTKDHAAENALEFCCPLDRQKVDVTRVFKDKLHERKVLSLKVECRNLADGCSWTGELRDAIDHEKKCGKNEKMVYKSFAIELREMSSRMIDLEMLVKCHEQQLKDKDKGMENQKKQIGDYSKQLEDQNILMEKQKKQMKNYSKQIEDQNILMEKQKKQMEVPNKQSLNHDKDFSMQNKVIVIIIITVILSVLPSWVCSKQMEDQKELIEILNIPIESMVMPNINVNPNFTPVSTVFQWKVNIVLDKQSVSPPFYNVMNGMCFQLGAVLRKNSFTIALLRYRGKYDHPTNEILTTQPFELVLHMIGNNGYSKAIKFSNGAELDIAQSKFSSKWLGNGISSDEMSRFIIDGYVRMKLFFNNK